MLGFKTQEENVWTNMKNTKLRLPLMEIRICEFAVIEERARCWLKSVGIDYDALEEHCGWIVLIGALIAMDKAEFYNEIKTQRANEGIVETYEGFLRQGIPIRDLQMIRNNIEVSMDDEVSVRLEDRLENQFNFSKFEAAMYLMANHVAPWMTKDDNRLNEVSDALYQFYIRARDDYFQGDDK